MRFPGGGSSEVSWGSCEVSLGASWELPGVLPISLLIASLIPLLISLLFSLLVCLLIPLRCSLLIYLLISLLCSLLISLLIFVAFHSPKTNPRDHRIQILRDISCILVL